MKPLSGEDTASAQLFLVTDTHVRPQSVLEALARLYRLYSYGSSGLSTVVRSEIERAALALTAVFLFDFGAWTLIWNAIFHRGELAFDRMTLLAASFGLISAVIVVSFEQGIITTDTTVEDPKARVKRGLTLALRVLVIGASAIATSSVIEVLVFANDIGDRVHEERVWEEVVSRVVQFQRLQDAMSGEGDNKPYVAAVTTAVEGVEKAKAAQAAIDKQLSYKRAELVGVQAELPDLRNEANRARAEANQAEAALNAQARQRGVATRADQRKHPELVSYYEDWQAASRKSNSVAGALKFAQNRVDRLTDEVAELDSKSGSNTAIVGSRIEVAKEARQTWQTRHAQTVAQRDALQRWITRIANSAPDEHAFTEGEFSYYERPYSFAEQLRVLSDLMHGKPPQRRNLLAVNQDVIATTLRLEHPKKQDALRKGERDRSAAALRQVYYGLLILAFFVPSMGLLFKLTMHPQLITYYSASHQARAGKLDAMPSF